MAAVNHLASVIPSSSTKVMADKSGVFASSIKTIFFVFVSLFFTACSSTFTGKNTFRSSDVEYEYVTLEDQIQEDIKATPTQFIASGQKDSIAWERARLFFDSYAGGGKIEASVDKKGRQILHMKSNKPGEQPCEFLVERVTVGETSQYQISCGGSSSASMMQAQNLSRFLQNGTLERQLLR